MPPQRNDRFARDAAIVIAVCILIHIPSFFRTAADQNEGLYAAVAREVVHGNLPYVTAWEAKPPLFFFVCGLAMAVFGVGFLAMHALSLIVAIAIALAALAIGRRCGERGELVGLMAGILCAALFGSNDGTAIEGELLACAPLTAAFALVSARPIGVRRAGLAGVLAACAFGCKVTVAPICAVALAAAVWGADAGTWAATIAGAALPLAAMVLPFAVTGHMKDLVDANISTVLRRVPALTPHPPPLDVVRQQVEAFFPLWLIGAGAAYAWGRERNRRTRYVLGLMIAWLAAGLISIAAIREFFGYQWTILIPPAAVLASWTLVRLTLSVRWLAATAVVTIAAHSVGQYLALARPDPYAQVAHYLFTLPPAERTSLYVATDNPGLYVLAGAPLPTRFPDPAHLYSPDMEAASGSPGGREIARIFAERPRVVAIDAGITSKSAQWRTIMRTVRERYHLAFSAGTHQIYLLDEP